MHRRRGEEPRRRRHEDRPGDQGSPHWEHINFHGTYPFNRPELPGRLRDLRDPTAADDPEL
ncbi:hypothetical protein Misp01_77750 [Microtetraspora sp. NBRC 13810]|nr:hypothetical protein Misp01_77750 [Microtetraspora sp. NBRC 13810]